MKRQDRRRGGRGEVRIIGGDWRRRRIRFPAELPIRPTPDRLRETLFNWLGDWIAGRRVLDLYAGSGALGIEALSRGAAEAVFVEHDSTAVRALAGNLKQLGARAARVDIGDAAAWLVPGRGSFDLVFLDPPYAEAPGPNVLQRLAASGVLAPDHRVYLEQSRTEAGRNLPVDWEVLRAGRAGDASGRLLRHAADKLRSADEPG